MNLLVDSAFAITTATENTEKTCNVFRGKTGSLHVAGGPSQLKNKSCANFLQIRWNENEKRAYILDERSAGGNVMEVPNPIDFPQSYSDFYLMLLKAFSYFDVTDLVRKLHTQTLLFSKSHIQNPWKVSEDKASHQVSNMPSSDPSCAFGPIQGIKDLGLNSSNCTVYQDYRSFVHSLMGAEKLLLCCCFAVVDMAWRKPIR